MGIKKNGPSVFRVYGNLAVVVFWGSCQTGVFRTLEVNRRRKNEKKFETWEDLANGGRVYSYDVQGRYGWTARYVKEVDASELTLRFYQEIYDNFGQLAEVHEKYPVDKGHEKIGRGEQL